MQWRPLLPKEGGLIQVDIGGHPPIPTGSKQSSGNLLFLAVFRFLNFRGHFEGLNEVFLGSCSASSEAVWLRKLLAGLFDLELEATCIWCDNQSCVKLSENPVFHDKSTSMSLQMSR
jgi:hypothetical protein